MIKSIKHVKKTINRGIYKKAAQFSLIALVAHCKNTPFNLIACLFLKKLTTHITNTKSKRRPTITFPAT